MNRILPLIAFSLLASSTMTQAGKPKEDSDKKPIAVKQNKQPQAEQKKAPPKPVAKAAENQKAEPAKTVTKAPGKIVAPAKIVAKVPVDQKAVPAKTVTKAPGTRIVAPAKTVDQKVAPARSVAKAPGAQKAVPAKTVAKAPAPKKAVPAKAVAKAPVTKKAEPAKAVAKAPVPKKAAPAKTVAKAPVPKKAVPAKTIAKAPSPKLDWGKAWEGSYIFPNGTNVIRNKDGISFHGSIPQAGYSFKKGQVVNTIRLESDVRINLEMSPVEFEAALSKIAKPRARTLKNSWAGDPEIIVITSRGDDSDSEKPVTFLDVLSAMNNGNARQNNQQAPANRYLHYFQ